MRNELEMAKAGGTGTVLADATVLIAVVPGLGPCVEKWTLVSQLSIFVSSTPIKMVNFRQVKHFLLAVNASPVLKRQC